MGRRRIYQDHHDNEIKDLYSNKKWSLREISRKFGYHPEVIKRRLLELGVSIRNRSVAMKNLWKQRKSES